MRFYAELSETMAAITVLNEFLEQIRTLHNPEGTKEGASHVLKTNGYRLVGGWYEDIGGFWMHEVA
jgi:hypothetical protein